MKRRNVGRILCSEPLEDRRCLSAVTFVEPVTVLTGFGFGTGLPVEAVDLDGDGDQDLITSSYFGGLQWIENTSEGEYNEPRRIAGIDGYQLADVDGDGDPDFITDGSWYENLDGSENLEERSEYKVQVDRDHIPADLDSDGDQDILLHQARTLVWFENVDGHGNFAELHRISFDTGESFAAADMDGDGDIDILRSLDQGEVVWLENVDGKGQFGDSASVGTHPERGSVIADDLDDDGDLDVVVSWYSQWGWSENVDGSFGEWQLFDKAKRFDSLMSADLDGDGDNDVILYEYSSGALFFENVDGLGHFVGHIVSAVRSLFPFDWDGDGDVDFLSQEWLIEDVESRILWHENRRIGDSNDDGTFDSSDLVSVFTAGKFETGTNATYDEGDWNQDGVFDSSDFVFAFQAGTYVTGDQPLAAEIADAIFGKPGPFVA